MNKYTDDNPLKLIIGNKCDLESNRQVTENDIKTMHESTGLEIIETSAKMSIKINEVMEIMTKKLILICGEYQMNTVNYLLNIVEVIRSFLMSHQA